MLIRLDLGKASSKNLAHVFNQLHVFFDICIASASCLAMAVIVRNVATETPLMEMGLDSLSAMDLQNLIATSFPFSGASNTILFDYPTVRELTEHLVEESKLAGL